MSAGQNPVTVYSLDQHPLMEMGNVPGMGMPSRLALHRELARHGFRVVFYQITDSSQNFVVPCDGVEVRCLRARLVRGKHLPAKVLGKVLNLPLWVLCAVYRLLPFFRRRKQAGERFVIYGHHQYAAIAASLIGTFLNVPNVTRLYGTLAPYMIGLSQQYPKSLFARLLGYLRVWEDIVALLMPASRYLITDDGTLGDKLFVHLKGHDKRLVFVRNGIDIDWPHWLSVPGDNGLANRIFGDTAPVVLSAGRLMEWKRMERVIEVARRLIASGARANFLILGNGDTEGALKRKIEELGLVGRVRILTSVRHTEMPQYLKAAAVVLLLQDYTNLSNTLLEALALEKPVVALDVGGTRTVVRDGDNGLLVPLDNWAEAATGAVARLLESAELRAKLAEGARRWRDEKAYNWEVRARVDVNIIRDLLGEGRAACCETEGVSNMVAKEVDRP